MNNTPKNDTNYFESMFALQSGYNLLKRCDASHCILLAIINSQNTCDISTHETYLNFIASKLYIRKAGCSVLRVYICILLHEQLNMWGITIMYGPFSV